MRQIHALHGRIAADPGEGFYSIGPCRNKAIGAARERPMQEQSNRDSERPMQEQSNRGSEREAHAGTKQ